jgi:hypothetical protein
MKIQELNTIYNNAHKYHNSMKPTYGTEYSFSLQHSLSLCSMEGSVTNSKAKWHTVQNETISLLSSPSSSSIPVLGLMASYSLQPSSLWSSWFIARQKLLKSLLWKPMTNDLLTYPPTADE